MITRIRRSISVSALSAVAVLPCHYCAFGSPLSRVPQGEAASVVHADYYQRCIFVKARLNGDTDLLVLLDTGANVSALDSAAAETAGVPIIGTSRVEGTAGTIRVRTAQIRSLSVGGSQVGPLTVTVQDLAGSLAPPGSRLGGILGYDFLRHCAIRIDYRTRTVSIAGEPAMRAYPDARRSSSVPFEIDNGIPRIRAVLNGLVATKLRLDTGASLFDTPQVYLNITQADWRRLKTADPALKPYALLQGSGVGGPVKLPVARIRSVTIGKSRVAAPNVIVQPPQGYFARRDAAGFVSNNLLEKYSPVIIDYRANELFLSPMPPRRRTTAPPPVMRRNRAPALSVTRDSRAALIRRPFREWICAR